MEIKIPTGVRHQIKTTVSDKDLALAYGSGEVKVYATPAMITLMEKTAMESVKKYLPEGFTTVGTEVNIKHLKATTIGNCVSAESYLKSVAGMKLIFELHTWDKKGMIGIGTHTRAIVNEAEFMTGIK